MRELVSAHDLLKPAEQPVLDLPLYCFRRRGAKPPAILFGSVSGRTAPLYALRSSLKRAAAPYFPSTCRMTRSQFNPMIFRIRSSE